MTGWAKLWPLRAPRAKQDAARLVDIVSKMALRPGFFGPGRAADSVDGRFEVAALHASLVFVRLEREAALAPLGQAFADTLFRRFDAGLREAGVGDLSVPKRMRKLAQAFYGRLGAYSAALAAGDEGALAQALLRNMLSPADELFARGLARAVALLAAAQAQQPAEALFSAESWGASPE
jgi:cytochrome b pre-mRNA-processing protein 3